MGALTRTIQEQGVMGDLRYQVLDLAFSTSYARGGDTGLAASDLGWDRIHNVVLESPVGYQCSYDHSAGKVLAYRGAPGLVVEEVVTIASNVGTLDYNPAYIVAVDVTAGGTTGQYNVIPTGETPLTRQVAVTFTSGLMTFLSTDAVTSVRVTYFPQRSGTIFDSANLVVDELLVAAAATVDTASRACMVQYLYDNTDNVIDALEPVGEAPSATHTAVIDITNTAATTIDFHADDEANSIKVTYIKYSALQDPSMAINDTDLTLVSEAYEFSGDGAARSNYNGLVVPGLGTQVVGEKGDASNDLLTWGGPSVTAGVALARWRPALNDILTNEAVAVVTLAMPWVVIPFNELDKGALAEVPAGEDLSGITSTNVSGGVRAMVYGR